MQNALAIIVTEAAKVHQGFENTKSKDGNLLTRLDTLKASQETFEANQETFGGRLAASEAKQTELQNKLDVCEAQVKELEVENTKRKCELEALRFLVNE